MDHAWWNQFIVYKPGLTIKILSQISNRTYRDLLKIHSKQTGNESGNTQEL